MTFSLYLTNIIYIISTCSFIQSLKATSKSHCLCDPVDLSYWTQPSLHTVCIQAIRHYMYSVQLCFYGLEQDQQGWLLWGGGCCRELAIGGVLAVLCIFHLADICFFIFLDSFLRMRDKADHEATAMMKAQFMSLWDGKQIVIQSLLFTLCKSLLWYYFLFSNCDILGARPIDSATLNCQLTPRLR